MRPSCGVKSAVKLAEHIYSEVVEDFPQSSKKIESSLATGEKLESVKLMSRSILSGTEGTALKSKEALAALLLPKVTQRVADQRKQLK